MSEQLKDNFISALNEIEQNENFDSMIELFNDSSKIGNVALTQNLTGKEGAKEFWKAYRDSFKTCKSTFHNELVSNNLVALEWTTEFESQQGDGSSYQGVSIIENDGDKITRFFAYFNPQALGEQLVKAANSKEI